MNDLVVVANDDFWIFFILIYWKIDDLENKGEFPKRIKLSANRVGWIATEVDAWFEGVVKNANR